MIQSVAASLVYMKIICFGDSNTFGFDPRSTLGERYPSECRWVDLLAEFSGWEVRNNGMNGREVPRREQLFSKDADLIVIMLGTNDLLQGNTAEDTADRMKRFLRAVLPHHRSILLIAPPPLQLGNWIQDESLISRSVLLGEQYRRVSLELGIHFADSGEWNIPIAFDGVHFTEEGHKLFAEKVFRFIAEDFA